MTDIVSPILHPQLKSRSDMSFHANLMLGNMITNRMSFGPQSSYRNSINVKSKGSRFKVVRDVRAHLLCDEARFFEIALSTLSSPSVQVLRHQKKIQNEPLTFSFLNKCISGDHEFSRSAYHL